MLYVILALLVRAELAVFSFVDSNVGCLLGGSQATEWVSDGTAATTMKGGDKYRVFTAKGPAGVVKAEKPVEKGAHCPETLLASLIPEPDKVTPFMAMTGDWNPLPRQPRDLLRSKAKYMKYFAPLLEKQGIHAAAKVQKLWEADLDADGKDEIVAVLSNLPTKKNPSDKTKQVKGGYYAAVMVRHTVDEAEAETYLVDFDEAYKDHEPTQLSVPFLLDLNGDNKLELVVYGNGSDGRYTTVYTMDDILQANGGKGGQALLGCSCSN